MLAIDLDGTLLRSDRRLHQADALLIRRLAERIPVLIVTARPPRSTRSIYHALDLNTPSVHYNGALTFDFTTGEVLEHQPIESDLLQQAIRIARESFPESIISIERLDQLHTDRIDQRFTTATSLEFGPDRVAPIDQITREPATKLMIHVAPSQLPALRRLMSERFQGNFQIVSTDSDLLQLTHPRSGKWPAIRKLLHRFNVDQKDVLCLGDNDNDVEMLASAGIGVAVANGSQDARSAAKVVAPSNDDHGVRWTIERFFPTLSHDA
jgi:Cof subfamily protein (haloacid dehalogenase superfamily)